MRQLIGSGNLAGANLTAGYVDVATFAAPATPGASYEYLLVMRFTGLTLTHEIEVRETQGVATVSYETQPGNGQTSDEIEYEEILAGGEGDIVVAIRDALGGTVAANVAWFLYRDAAYAPSDPGGGLPAPSDGYFVRRVDLLLEMGQEVFDGEIKLNPDDVVADETIVAEKLREADDLIDVIAMDVGLPIATAGAGAGLHFLRSDIVAPANDLDRLEQLTFGAVRKLGAKLARALVRPLRPDAPDEPRTALAVIGSPPPAQNTDPSGGYTRQKNSALKSIREVLTAFYERRNVLAVAEPENDIVAVGWNDDGRRGWGRCRYPSRLPPGLDPDVLF